MLNLQALMTRQAYCPMAWMDKCLAISRLVWSRQEKLAAILLSENLTKFLLGISHYSKWIPRRDHRCCLPPGIWGFATLLRNSLSKELDPT